MDLLTTAKTLTDRVEAEATQAKIPVSVCVLDVHGNLVLQHRMNGAPACLHVSARGGAHRRSRTARAAGPAALSAPHGIGGRYTAMGGGVPLSDGGKVFAGVSGGANEQDIAIVEEAALR